MRYSTSTISVRRGLAGLIIVHPLTKILNHSTTGILCGSWNAIGWLARPPFAQPLTSRLFACRSRRGAGSIYAVLGELDTGYSSLWAENLQMRGLQFRPKVSIIIQFNSMHAAREFAARSVFLLLLLLSGTSPFRGRFFAFFVCYLASGGGLVNSSLFFARSTFLIS